ncbi:MAG: DUF418 domain-containing protein [Bacteroidaceae bacterium]|nr:DUF418 domain-containing protein [Bacteroidaceae bacterium]
MMPDHIHLLLRVNGPMPEGKHLGIVVRGFKTGCSRAWWQWQDEVGVGLGLGTSFGLVHIELTALGVFLLQVLLSRLWLRYFPIFRK